MIEKIETNVYRLLLVSKLKKSSTIAEMSSLTIAIYRVGHLHLEFKSAIKKTYEYFFKSIVLLKRLNLFI